MTNTSPPRRFALWVIPVIAMGTVVAVSMLSALFFGLSSMLDALSSDQHVTEGAAEGADEDQPLVEGAASSPSAVSPILCPDECYNPESVRLLTMGDADFRKLGVDQVAGFGRERDVQ